MENNEIMNYEDIEVMDDAIVEEGRSGMGTGTAMLLGAGLAFAVGGAVKLGKRIWTKYKAKKELQETEGDTQAKS